MKSLDYPGGREVLFEIARRGDGVTRLELWRDLKFNRASIFRIVTILTNDDLITVSHSARVSKTGIVSAFYVVTLEGRKVVKIMLGELTKVADAAGIKL